MSETRGMERVIGRILKDISIELGDEFDKNFEREAFFTERWQRRRSPIRPGRALLVDTGKLRQSARSESTATSISKLYDLEGKFNDEEYTSIMALFRESNVAGETVTNYYFSRKGDDGVWRKIEPSFCRL